MTATALDAGVEDLRDAPRRHGIGQGHLNGESHPASLTDFLLSSSVAPRTALCISVRFQMVACALVICMIAAVVTMAHTPIISATATSSSISENPASPTASRSCSRPQNCDDFRATIVDLGAVSLPSAERTMVTTLICLSPVDTSVMPHTCLQYQSTAA